MPTDRIAVAFANAIGNFILFTSAIKILKSWGYNKIDLLTDHRFQKNPALVELSEGMFENILTEFDERDYDRVFIPSWSRPWDWEEIIPQPSWRWNQVRNMSFLMRGTHEVLAYLQMIGATWQDFDGFIFEPADDPVLRSAPPRIALANPNTSQQAEKKRWDKFPELSQMLEDMGFTVVLLGIEGELEGCTGINYTGKLSLRQAAKVLQQCDLLIAPSTCLAHVADCVGTPILQLEGPVLGTKTHPLIAPYRVVRKYISCAPCFQSGLMKRCQDPKCMTNIQVDDVLQEMFRFMNRKSTEPRKTFINQIRSTEGVEPVECDATVAYLIPCFNRYYVLKEFLTSFKESCPLPGAMLFLNDASTDPRVQELLEEFEVDGCKKYIFETDPRDKERLLRSHNKSPSTHAYNRLLDEVKKMDGFDYVSILDPDALLKPYWVQTIITTYLEARQVHQEIGVISGFNFTTHPSYDVQGTETVYETSAGKYRLRRGANLHYMMSWDFMQDVYGRYDTSDVISQSSDISKNAALANMGYRAMVTVPSVMQQLGALSSSFPRQKSNEIVWDF